ncbi:MAG: translational GTPase TypA [Limnochordaceae bacterium]|nr:translational GTPase TypA [Limnochordaceae bacterium]
MQIRNVAIIAHVDHGKTTLVDAILRQTGSLRGTALNSERVMDSNELERERGITILAKNTAVFYHDVKINIVDTPGHADFGGEVERILDMVDGCLLLVDAFEGPMPQTRFVVEKALSRHLRPVVVLNKIDRDGIQPEKTLDDLLELMIDLGADDSQIDFPVFYASARAGVADASLDKALAATRQVEAGANPLDVSNGILPLLDAIVKYCPAPGGDPDAPLQLLVTTLDWDDYLGRIGIGRMHNGRIRPGQTVGLGRGEDPAQNDPGRPVQPMRVQNLFTFQGLKRLPIEEAVAGDIVAVAGMEGLQIGDTVTSAEEPRLLPPIQVDEPTLTMIFRVNDSPFAGRDGEFVTSRQLRDRLQREARTNVALRVRETGAPDEVEVAGRGELQLAILIETMRREGYEFAVSRPRPIYKQVNGELWEPLERLTVDVPQESLGTVMEKLGIRRGELLNMTPVGSSRVRLDFLVPARGLIGFNSEFVTDTKGYGIMSHTYGGYGPYRGDIPARLYGTLIAWENGVATAYALGNLQDRGTFFIEPGTEVYEGMIVGESSRNEDIDVNVAKKKHLTNMRSSTSDIAVKLDVPRRLTLEQCIAFLADDELLEVTPQHLRLRKRVLSRVERWALRARRGSRPQPDEARGSGDGSAPVPAASGRSTKNGG